MAGKEGSLGERLGGAFATRMADRIEAEAARLESFDASKDRAEVERGAKAAAALALAARRILELPMVAARIAAAKADDREIDDEDDEGGDGPDGDAERAHLKRIFAGYDALAAAGRPDRRLAPPGSSGGGSMVVGAGPASPA